LFHVAQYRFAFDDIIVLVRFVLPRDPYSFRLGSAITPFVPGFP
jgi:hypothetical protein